VSWLSREFAEQQYAVVSDELRGIYPDVYLVFLEAMASVSPKTSLLDIGCGVGGYGFVCKKSFHKMRYMGTDISKHMVEFAGGILPGGDFRTCEFFDNFELDYASDADVILASGSMEYTEAPFEALHALLWQTHATIILHRLHLTPESSHEVSELAYCDEHINKMHWNKQELCDTISTTRKISWMKEWTRKRSMLTLVIESDAH